VDSQGVKLFLTDVFRQEYQGEHLIVRAQHLSPRNEPGPIPLASDDLHVISPWLNCPLDLSTIRKPDMNSITTVHCVLVEDARGPTCVYTRTEFRPAGKPGIRFEDAGLSIDEEFAKRLIAGCSAQSSNPARFDVH
jgi:hypothetical protein